MPYIDVQSSSESNNSDDDDDDYYDEGEDDDIDDYNLMTAIQQANAPAAIATTQAQLPASYNLSTPALTPSTFPQFTQAQQLLMRGVVSQTPAMLHTQDMVAVLQSAPALYLQGIASVLKASPALLAQVESTTNMPPGSATDYPLRAAEMALRTAGLNDLIATYMSQSPELQLVFDAVAHPRQTRQNIGLPSQNATDPTIIRQILLTGNAASIRRVIQLNPDVAMYINQQLKTDGQTALHIATLEADVDIVTLLIEHGANVNAETKNRSRPLHFAAFSNNMDIIDLLIAHGADLAARCQGGSTALHHVRLDLIVIYCNLSCCIILMLIYQIYIAFTHCRRFTKATLRSSPSFLIVAQTSSGKRRMALPSFISLPFMV